MLPFENYLFLIFNHSYKTHNIKFTILTFLIVQFSYTKHIHIVVQLSLFLVVSSLFSSLW